MSPDDSDYVPRDDESEAQRYRDVAGNGEVLYMSDLDIKAYALNNFEYDFEQDEHK